VNACVYIFADIGLISDQGILDQTDFSTYFESLHYLIWSMQIHNSHFCCASYVQTDGA